MIYPTGICAQASVFPQNKNLWTDVSASNPQHFLTSLSLTNIVPLVNNFKRTNRRKSETARYKEAVPSQVEQVDILTFLGLCSTVSIKLPLFMLCKKQKKM